MKLSVNLIILEIFRSYLINEDDAINLDTNLDIFNLDSLDIVEITLKFENMFKISIDDDDIERYQILLNHKSIRYITNILKTNYNIYDIKEERKNKILKINEK